MIRKSHVLLLSYISLVYINELCVADIWHKATPTREQFIDEYFFQFVFNTYVTSKQFCK